MKLWDLLMDGDLKVARSKAELIRTVFAALGSLCAFGSLVILLLVHVI